MATVSHNQRLLLRQKSNQKLLPGGSTVICDFYGRINGDNDWIGLRENLQETIDFPIKYGAFL